MTLSVSGYTTTKAMFGVLLLTTLSFSCNKKQQHNTPRASGPQQAVLACEIPSRLGEGAIWNHESQELFWVDIEGKKLHIYDPQSNKNRTLNTPSRVGTVVPVDENEAIIALEDGIYMIDLHSGATTLFSGVESDITENRFNDGKCDPAGRLWVGSMHLAETEPNATLYMINADGTAEAKLDSITISNGIVWSADQKTMYYIDTPTAKIRAFDFDPASGAIANERIAVHVHDSIGFPDGMAIDAEGMLWVGMWNGNAVARFNPKTGKLLSRIPVPAHNVTSCAFGGKDLDTLYITTASIDMTAEEHSRFPKAGSIFKVVPGVKGVKSSFFKRIE